MTTATVEATPVWRLAVASFLPLAKRDRALRAWIPRLPLILLLVVQAVLSLRLSNTAHGDEALYINAGIDYFDHWAHGTTIQTFGDYFSGAPVAFPVLAAVLNWIGGLWLVRIAGLLVMIGATLCVYAVTRHLWGRHAGVAASWTFVLAGPVVFLGKFATFDPWTVGFLAAALWLGVVRVGYASAALAGLSLAAAVAFKYTGMVFVPIVVAVIALTPRHDRARPMVRAGVALLSAAGTLGALYLLFGTAVRQGIYFTTTHRAALFPAPVGELARFLFLDIGTVIVPALFGAAVAARSVRSTLLTLAFLAGGAALPLSQMRLGELVSFEKHLGYSVLFLAPLAGVALVWLARRWRAGVVALAAVVAVMAMVGLDRSAIMYQGWPPVQQVVSIIDAQGQPGRYFAGDFAYSMRYYMRDAHPNMIWEEQYSLFAQGHAAIREAVETQHYEGFVIRSMYQGTNDHIRDSEYLMGLLRNNPDYRLVRDPFPTRPYAPDKWLVYLLVRR